MEYKLWFRLSGYAGKSELLCQMFTLRNPALPVLSKWGEPDEMRCPCGFLFTRQQ